MTDQMFQQQRRLRIAVLARIFSTSAGGAERYCASLVKHLAPQHEIHVFAQDIRTSNPDVIFHTVPLFCRRPRWLNQIAFAIYTWWKTRKGFDVVHSHENTWHGDVQTIHVLPFGYLWFVHRAGFRLFLQYVKLTISPRLLTYWFLEKLRMRHQQGRFLVAVSKTVLGVLQNDLGHDKKNIRVIPPGIEYSFNHDIHAKKQARLDWGLPLDGHCLLWVGNNATKKGLPSLLEALNQLSPNIFLVITGAASPENVWRLLVTKLQLEKRVYFKGVMEDMSIAYRAADLLVHPSLEDTFGMVVLEAMSHGVPAVVSDARYCGISADLEHQVNAWLLDKPQDPQALKHAIEISLEPSQHISLGQQALRWASSQNWNQLARTQESLYYDVVRLKE